ncbi:hypothetical protein CYD30_19955 [Kosakonia cowanii]|nr:hypothetical protein CYD30_19955 [Kosakonia cowanii]
MIGLQKSPEQTCKTLLIQKRFALASTVFFTCCLILSVLLTIVALIIDDQEWLIRAFTMIVLCVPLLLLNAMTAVQKEFKGWKLVNRINTHAEGATFAAFRADNGLNKTLRFGQCGFKRGEK